jgi:hypothetical protein
MTAENNRMKYAVILLRKDQFANRATPVVVISEVEMSNTPEKSIPHPISKVATVMIPIIIRMILKASRALSSVNFLIFGNAHFTMIICKKMTPPEHNSVM